LDFFPLSRVKSLDLPSSILYILIDESTGSAKNSTPSPDKGQRAGKAPMIIEETPKKSKEQVLQEEASLAEAIRLDTLQKEKVAKQVHLDSLLAQRIAEEEELNEQQKKRKDQVQFEAQHYTNKDWDLIRAKIEANAELSKSMLGSELQGEDFAKKMVDLVNQRKKYFAEERARAKRNKPMTQSQLKKEKSMLGSELQGEDFAKKMVDLVNQRKKWDMEVISDEEFDKLVKQVESFAPINFEATKASLKRFGEVLQKKNPKRLKDDEAKDKKSRKRRKQMARRGLHTNIDKDDSEEMIFTELYRIVMNRYGMDGPEDELEKVSWKYLKNMFEEPLSTDPIWSLLEKNPISAEICKTMLNKKLQGGKPDEDCYKMLKMMEKQAGIRK
ncbi:hypothetical protein Tco_1048433, partial [Tanacetum coccineum]